MHSAAARSYCELYVIDAATLSGAITASHELTQGMLDTLSQRLSAAHEVIAQRVNYQPELVVYADLLHLVGMADLGRQASRHQRRRRAPRQPSAGSWARPTTGPLLARPRAAGRAQPCPFAARAIPTATPATCSRACTAST
jgi:CRP-like cAMP-binding protein